MPAVIAVPSLPELAKDFARWRSTHRKHARLPDDLKEKAALLGATGVPVEVAKAINVSTGLLQDWIDRLGPLSDSNDPPSFAREETKPPAVPPFIDMTSAFMPPAPVATVTEPVTIELTLPDRGSLKVAGVLDAATIRFIVSSAFGGAR